jgi:iron complex outermembrane recepter protein
MPFGAVCNPVARGGRDRLAIIFPAPFLKWAAVIFLIDCLAVNSKAYSQTVSVSVMRAPLTSVFSIIREQTGYVFFYDRHLLKNTSLVSLNMKNASLQSVLDSCIKSRGLDYSIENKTITLFRKPTANQPDKPNTGNKPAAIEVHGIVASDRGQRLARVSIAVQGEKMGTATDADGVFTIAVSVGQILLFSSVGFVGKSVKVDGNPLSVVLETKQDSMSDVVVTSYAIRKSNRNLGYSVTTIGGGEIERTNSINPITALQGKVAGVMVNVMSSAGVQTSPYIQMRGASVLGGNNQPIFVVDGNVLQNNISGPDKADGGSQLKNLNPDDYESITVLKGAAATAIYGSRGLNGAIVITTKSGKAGTGLGVDFMDLQNEYGMGSYFREGAFAPDGSQTYAHTNWGPKFDGSLHPTTYGVQGDGSSVPYAAMPDNWKAFYRDGNYINNNISFSGGSEKSAYRLSYSNTGDRGILPNNSMKRNALNIKIGGAMNKVFSAEIGINFANTVSANYFNQSRYFWPVGGNLGFDAYYMPRNTDFSAWHATYRNADNSTKPTNFNFVVNGFGILDKNNYTNTENSLLGYVQLKAQVTPWLDLSGRGNINYYKQFAETRNYGNEVNNAGGTYAIDGGYTNQYNILFIAHLTKKVMNNSLGIDFRLLNEYYGNLMGESYSASTEGGLKVPNEFFLGNSVNAPALNGGLTYGSINASGTLIPGPIKPNSLTIGLAGILNLNYKQYLNLELTGRNDWLSALTYPAGVPGQNNYTAFYPSANVSYSFFDHLGSSMPGWLSSGRLRASLAYTGSAGLAAPYSTGAGYTPGIVVDQNGNSVSSATQNNGNIRPNYNLQPQIQRALEFGANVSFLNHLIDIDFTWYKTNTLHQLLHIDGVQETGYDTFYFNAGNIQNQGYELLVEVNPVKTKDWYVDIAVKSSVSTLALPGGISPMITRGPRYGPIRAASSAFWKSGEIPLFNWIRKPVIPSSKMHRDQPIRTRTIMLTSPIISTHTTPRSWSTWER